MKGIIAAREAKRAAAGALAFVALFLFARMSAAEDARWTSPEATYSVGYSSAWLIVPPRPNDPATLRLAPQSFDPSAPMLCNVTQYPIQAPQDWERGFGAWQQNLANSMDAQTAARAIPGSAGYIDHVAHTTIGDVAVAEIFLAHLPINGVVFRVHYRMFGVRGEGGPIIVMFDCRGPDAMSEGQAAELEAVLSSLHIPG